jgi:hypothetical protein
MVYDSFFSNLHDGWWGGAIYTTSSTGALYVDSTTFLKCSVSVWGAYSYGGAIYHEGEDFGVSMSCFRETGSDDYATAIHISSARGAKGMVLASCVKCYNMEENPDATIHDEDGAGCEIVQCNFSECRLVPDAYDGNGVVFLCEGQTGTLTFMWSTVLYCVGSTAIHSYSLYQGQIIQCNFYGNRVQTSKEMWAVFYGEKVGMIVTECIFCNNSNIFILESSKSRVFFTVIDCIFDRTISSSAIYSGNSGNLFNTLTASLDGFYAWMPDCPTSSPTISASPAKTQTIAEVRSASPVPSATETETQSPIPSQSPQETVSASQSWYCEVYADLRTRVAVLCPFCLEVAHITRKNRSY